MTKPTSFPAPSTLRAEMVELDFKREKEGAGERAVNHLSIISPSPSRSGGDDEDDALVDPLAALGRGRTAVQN